MFKGVKQECENMSFSKSVQCRTLKMRTSQGEHRETNKTHKSMEERFTAYPRSSKTGQFENSNVQFGCFRKTAITWIHPKFYYSTKGIE